MERFKFAEAAWRVEQSRPIRDFLSGCYPEQIIEQMNRVGETRYVVRYSQSPSALNHPQAIVPAWVCRACPKDKRSFQNENWVA